MRRTDRIDSGRATALAGLLDLDLPLAAGGALPLMWHLPYFLDRPRQQDIGPDGHPAIGFPSAPESGLRRMFAGGRLAMHAGLHLDEEATSVTEVAAQRSTEGRTGRITIITTRTSVTTPRGLAMVDERDIAYLPGRAAGTPERRASPEGRLAHHLFSVPVDTTLLFRFSALTYNSHRIHYDRDYARDVEGYADLVVHGPLQALLLARAGESLLTQGAPATMEYRLVAPLLLGQGCHAHGHVSGETAHVEIRDDAGRTTATARLTSGA